MAKTKIARGTGGAPAATDDAHHAGAGRPAARVGGAGAVALGAAVG